MSHPTENKQEETKPMSNRSNRYGYDPFDKLDRPLAPEKKDAMTGPAQTQTEETAVEIERLKKEFASKVERPKRKGGPLPGDFHWGYYPNED